MALEQTGLEFVAENEKEFTGAIDNAAGAMQAFEGVGESVSQSFDVFGEIITGALRHMGEIALETLINMTAAVKDFALGAFEGALDAERGLVKLRGAIKRAGDSAAVTEDRALELAQELKGLAGGSDDAVIAAEAMLLKFQDVGEDVFPAALRVSLDLAEVLGTDAAHAAEMLGRALGNPEQASRLLRQAGVFLNDEEKELIKSFAESGNAADAQVFILDKLTHATGGAAADAAATLSGQWDIFKETIADTAEGLATGFIPVLQSLFEEHIKPNLPVIQDLMTSFANLLMMLVTGDFKGGIFGLMEDDFFIDGLLQFRNVAVDVFNWIMTIGLPMLAMFITNGWNWLNDAIQGTIEFIQTIALPMFYRLSDWFKSEAMPVIQPVIDALVGIFNAVINQDIGSLIEQYASYLGALFSIFKTVFEEFIKPELEKLVPKLLKWIGDQGEVVKKKFLTEWLPDAEKTYNEFLKPILDSVIAKVLKWAEDQRQVLEDKLIQEWRPAFIKWTDVTKPALIRSLGEMLGEASAWMVTVGIPEFVNSITNSLAENMKKGASGIVTMFVDSLIMYFRVEFKRLEILVGQFFDGFVTSFGANVDWGPISESLARFNVVMMFQFQQIGHDIIYGIAEGIRNNSFAVFSALFDSIQDAIDWVRDAFNIHSPSGITASIIGEPIGKGIAEGILSTIGDIKGAMQGVTIGAMNSVSPAASGSQMTTINNSRASSYAPTLNVNSSQSSQGIVSDFSILQAMSG